MADRGTTRNSGSLWIIDHPDGHGEASFTMGSRSAKGVEDYFRVLLASYKAVRGVVPHDAVIVQLVSFGDSQRQHHDF